MQNLSLSNVINISIAQAGQGIGAYNTSNLGIFTREVPDPAFDDGYKIYLEPTEVAEDFGSDSETYKMALGIFSQQPNILANSGYLVVMTMLESDAGTNAVQSLSFPQTPDAGVFRLAFPGGSTADLAFGISAGQLQTAIRLISGMGSALVTGSVGAGFSIDTGIKAVLANATITNNTLTASATPVVPVVATTTPGVAPTAAETLAEAILRTSSMIQYFGILITEVLIEADLDAAAALVQTLNKLLGVVSRTAADLEPNGMFDDIRLAGQNKTRCLYYGSDNDSDALVMCASYFGRLLSVVFSGSNTTITMHLKDLVGILPDPSLTQTQLNKALVAGVDTYPSLEGVPKVFCSGANDFVDQVYNLGWLVGALQIAGFNLLAQTSTKLPQTEQGMDTLKGAYREVCEQGVTNQYLAPGRWTSPTTFGNQADLLANISQRGYYIFSVPVNLQSPTDRAARIAPLIQIAVKEAGAIQKSNVIVNINP